MAKTLPLPKPDPRAVRQKRRAFERKITSALTQQLKELIHPNVDKLAAAVYAGGMLRVDIAVAMPDQAEPTTPQTPGE